MAYLGKSPSQGVRNRYYFTASGGETSISGALTGGTLTFTDGNYVDVNLNGVTLVAGTDYNTSTANTIAGLSALTASDVVEIVVYDVFSVFSGNVNSDFSVGGNLSVTGTTAFTGATTITGLTTTGDINFGDNDKAIFGAGSDLQIYHDGGNSRIAEVGNGRLTLETNGDSIRLTKGTTENMLIATPDGSVDLYHNNLPKLVTTATGVDVTGTVTADGLTVDTNTLHVDATNNRVGIATVSPERQLHVEGAGLIKNTSGEALFKLQAANNSNSILELADTDDGNVGRVQYEHDNNAMLLYTNDTERLRIDSSGNVGIGTTSPSELLDVYSGSTNARIQVQTNNSSSVPQIEFRNTAAGTQIGMPANVNAMAFYTADTERMRIDSSGNVGIGTSPSELLHIRNASGDAAVRVQGNTRTFNIQQYDYGLRFVDVDAGNAERLRIHASGNLTVASSTNVGTADHKVSIQKGTSGRCLGLGTTLTSATIMMSLVNGNGTVGSIQTNGTSTSYVTSSDYRLKENVVADWDATTRLKQLNPVRFNFIADADTTVDGFLAHEVQDVVPEAITGTKDAMRDEEYEVTPAVFDEDGNEITPAVMGTRSVPDYQGIDQSKLVPLLVKTIQELEARIAALEA